MNPRLSILHSVLSLAPQWGSLGESTVHLAHSQRSLGHRSAIWCLDTFSPMSNLSDVRVFPSSAPARLGYSRAMTAAAASAAGKAYDVLHQHGLWRAFSRATDRWRAAHGRPTVLAPAGTLTREALRFSRWRKKLAAWAYERRNLRRASCLHAESTLEALGFRRYGLSNPIAVIPSGVPDAWLTERGNASSFRRRFALPPDRRLMLFLGRLHPIKGLPLLLDALASSRTALGDWLLLVAGESELGHRVALEARARELGLLELVRFVGHVRAPEKRDAFAAADLLLLPTLSESFGIVVAEALGAGVPVLTTRGAPWPELASEGCGWYVDTTSAGIGEALRDAAGRSSRELRAMGQRGRGLVQRKYTWSRVAELTVELYDWLLGSSARPSFVEVD